MKKHVRTGKAGLPALAIGAVLLIVVGFLAWSYLWNSDSNQLLNRLPAVDTANLTSRAKKMMESCEESIRLNPKDASAWGLLGRACLSHQFSDEAKQCFEVAAELEPNNFEWYYSQALAIEETDRTQAIELIRKAIELCDQGKDQLQCRLAELLFEEADFPASRELMTALLDQYPKHARGNMLMARLKLMDNELEDSLRCAQFVVAVQPMRKEALRLLSQVHSRLGNANEANQFSQQAEDPQAFDEAWPDVIYQKVYALRKDVNKLVADALRLPPAMVEERIQVLRDAIEEEPHEPNWFGYLGQTYLLLRQYEQAIGVLMDGIKIHPDAAILHYTLGLVYLNQGNYRDAIPVLEKAVAVKQDYDLALLNLGIAYRQDSQLEKSIDAIKRAIAILPGSFKSQLNLAVTLEMNQQTSDAIDAYLECIRLDDQSAEVHLMLGKLLASLPDRKDEAKKYLKKSLELDASLIEAQSILNSLN